MAEVNLLPGEAERIADAEAALAKDPHAPRELSVKVLIHKHQEYPKLLYRGNKTRVVNSDEEHDAAAQDGFGKFVPEAPSEE